MTGEVEGDVHQEDPDEDADVVDGVPDGDDIPAEDDAPNTAVEVTI